MPASDRIIGQGSGPVATAGQAQAMPAQSKKKYAVLG